MGRQSTLLALGAIMCAVCAPGFAQEPPARPAKVFTVSERDAFLRRSYPAIVLPSREVELSFRVSGRVIDLPIRAAVEVGEGDLIAQLDPRDFQTQVVQLESQIATAQAQLDALRAGARAEEIAALEAGVNAAQAQFDQAEDAVERVRALVDRGVSTTAQLEGAEANFRVAQANLRAAQEELRIGQAGGRPEEIAASEASIRGLEAQLKVAQDNLADTTLVAPFPGIIARRDIENFTNIQAGAPVVLLQDIAIVHLSFDIPGPDVTAMTSLGQDLITITATFDALPGDIFTTDFVEFSVQADSATQTYRGRVSVAVPADRFILPGMVARVEASAPSAGREVQVPLSAVAAQPDGSPFVWLLEGETVASRTVTLGQASGDMVVIAEGVAPGDTVVSAGVSQVLEGMRIRPITTVGD